MNASSWDIAVIGGGGAGVAAAVTAARLGATTLLVECSGELGGTGLHGLHPFICGLYRNDPAAPFALLNHGLAEEIVLRLDALAGVDGRHRRGRVEVHALRTPHYQRVLAELVAEQRGLRVALQTRLSATVMEGSRIERIRLAGADAGEVSAARVIDASGDGAVLQACAAGCEPANDERQLAGYCFRLLQVNDPGRMAAIRVPYVVRRAVERGELTAELKYTTFLPDESGTEGICKLSLPTGIGMPEAKTRAHAWAVGIHALLRREAPEFADSTLADVSPRVLERSGRSLEGAYRLDADDVLNGRRFDDGVVRGAWPIEFWDPVKGPSMQYLQPGDWYDVPTRCLRSARISNLYATGRCISATGRALASVRVMGTCLALGEAAARVALDSIPPPMRP